MKQVWRTAKDAKNGLPAREQQAHDERTYDSAENAFWKDALDNKGAKRPNE